MGLEGKKNILGSRDHLVNPTVEGTIMGALSGADGFVLRDIKNLPDGVLSGTPKLVEVNIDGATYYLKIYPVLI